MSDGGPKRLTPQDLDRDHTAELDRLGPLFPTTGTTQHSARKPDRPFKDLPRRHGWQPTLDDLER